MRYGTGEKTGTTSKFRGVSRGRSSKRPWTATVYHEERALYIGRYALEEDAALAFDIAARVTRGPEARLNFAPTKPCSLEMMTEVFARLSCLGGTQ